MKELQDACREAYLAYIDSRGAARETAIYAGAVTKYVKALKAKGPDAINAYYAWCRGEVDLTKDVKSVDAEQQLRHA